MPRSTTKEILVFVFAVLLLMVGAGVATPFLVEHFRDSNDDETPPPVSSSSTGTGGYTAASSSSSAGPVSSVVPFIVFPAQSSMTNLLDGWTPPSLDNGTIAFVSDGTRGNVANFTSADFYTPYPIPASYSICLWFTVGATNNNAWVFVAYGGAQADNTTFQVGISAPATPATGTLQQKRVKQFGSLLLDVTSYQMPTFSLNTWYHACFTWDTTTKIASNYLNGNLVATDTFPNEPWTGAGSTIRVGTGDGLGLPYVGLIQGLAIWNASISDQQVARVYSQQTGANQVSPLAQYL